MNEAIDLYQQPVSGQLVAMRDPEEVLEEARKAAVALQRVISAKPKKVMMGGEQYLEFEDWQTVARFYGATVKVREVRFVDYGGVQGFEATADVIDVRTGNILSSAEAMCLNDEEKWSARPKYGYVYVLKDGTRQEQEPENVFKVCELEPTGKSRPDGTAIMKPKKERVLLGEERVPLFQLRSMAQTRASAKALRNVYSWVVVLAGYKPTPAEEMEGVPGVHDEHAPAGKPAAASREPGQDDGPAPEWGPDEVAAPDKPKPTNGGRVITEKQVGRLCAICKQFGVSDDALHDHLVTKYGLESRTKIPMADYDDVCSWVTNHGSGK